MKAAKLPVINKKQCHYGRQYFNKRQKGSK